MLKQLGWDTLEQRRLSTGCTNILVWAQNILFAHEKIFLWKTLRIKAKYLMIIWLLVFIECNMSQNNLRQTGENTWKVHEKRFYNSSGM